MLLSFFKYLLGFSIFLNVLLMTLRIDNYVARDFDNISYNDYMKLSNKRYDDGCSIYCDTHGCTHKSYLKPYYKYVQLIDVKKHSFHQYQKDTLFIYLGIFPLLIYSVLYLIVTRK